MRAIILAAGMGTRLGEYTRDLPKGMLHFAGKSLIERQIDTLKSAGIDDIVIVRGYKKEKIDFPSIRYYTNEDYAETNMVATLFIAEQELEGDILVCYSDIIYEKKTLEKVLSYTGDIGVAVDVDYLPYWKDRLADYEKDIESLIIDEKGRILELGEQSCPLEKARARYVGLLRFSEKGIENLRRVYHENAEKYLAEEVPWLHSKSFKKAYMTDLLQAAIDRGFVVGAIPIKRGWMEFDTVEDYEKAAAWIESGKIDEYIHL